MLNLILAKVMATVRRLLASISRHKNKPRSLVNTRIGALCPREDSNLWPSVPETKGRGILETQIRMIPGVWVDYAGYNRLYYGYSNG